VTGRWLRKIGAGAAALVLLLGLWQGDAPVGRAAGDITFPQTGMSLSDAHGFLAYWQAYGGLAQFGYPLTPEELEVSPTDGRVYLTQWFERNRFEWHPENADGRYRVLLGLLGTQLTARRRATDAAFQPAPDAHAPDGRFFPQTGHNLAGPFRAYWEQHGGLAIYGYPLSEPFSERSATDGKVYTVQYFERNRFEWHPENADPRYQVLLGLLGAQIGGFPTPALPPSDTAAPLAVPDAFRGVAAFANPHTLTGPRGMQVSVFGAAGGLRMMAVAPNGDLFVSATRSNRVLAMPDRDHDGVADVARVFTEELQKPHGLAFHNGYLYVATEKAVYRYPYTPGQLVADEPAQKIADLPFGTSQNLVTDNNHDTRSITFGPDNKMYVSVGSDCDACTEGDPARATILQFNDDGGAGRIYASGLRNAVGIDVDPHTGLLWASVNERNAGGNDYPPDFFTPIRAGADYGWPTCAGVPLRPDPAFHASEADCVAKDSPVVPLPAHMAPLGIRFYTGGGLLPAAFENGAFIAMHGSTLHDPTYGADIRFVSMRPGRLDAGAAVVISGWLVDGHYWGRPVDIVFGADGAMYISDDLAGAVYRLVFNGV
jgi:glucose/arabinose dehydrogenase